MSHDEYINLIKSSINVSSENLGDDLEKFCTRCTYLCNNGDGGKPFIDLRKHMEEIGSGSSNQDRLFYMALPPKAYVSVSEQLKKNCYSKNGVSRIIVSIAFYDNDNEELKLSLAYK